MDMTTNVDKIQDILVKGRKNKRFPQTKAWRYFEELKALAQVYYILLGLHNEQLQIFEQIQIVINLDDI